MNSLFIKRTDSSNPDFVALVRHLDAELATRDGDDHAFYAQFNKIDSLKNVVVAYWNGKAVGCGAFKPLEDGVMEVKRMFVSPELRGKGIASSVLSELEHWASELGAHSCCLETGLRQPEAIALYQKNGYDRIPNYGQYMGVENSVCFEKHLLMSSGV
ncbi:MAG: GNAT family N-acetyltransferase [Saprospiraceae bacterium]|nr:GNAT family N-acetyltransferase [Saprospiraceae bacterium]